MTQKYTEAIPYLGKVVPCTDSSDLEIERRIQSTGNRSCCYIACYTKIDLKVCSVAVILHLLFSTECVSLYCRHIKAVMRGQLRHICSNMCIRYRIAYLTLWF